MKTKICANEPRGGERTFGKFIRSDFFPRNFQENGYLLMKIYIAIIPFKQHGLQL